MLTFGCGKYFVRASSIDEGLAIVRELERMDTPKQENRKEHIFNRDNQCVICGVSKTHALMNSIPCNRLPEIPG